MFDIYEFANINYMRIWEKRKEHNQKKKNQNLNKFNSGLYECILMFHNSEHNRVVRNNSCKCCLQQLTNIYRLVRNEFLYGATKYM